MQVKDKGKQNRGGHCANHIQTIVLQKQLGKCNKAIGKGHKTQCLSPWMRPKESDGCMALQGPADVASWAGKQKAPGRAPLSMSVQKKSLKEFINGEEQQESRTRWNTRETR